MASRILPPTPLQRLMPRVAPVPATIAETAGVSVVETVASVVEAVEAVAIPAAPSKVNPSTRKKAGYLKVPAFFSIFTSL